MAFPVCDAEEVGVGGISGRLLAFCLVAEQVWATFPQLELAKFWNRLVVWPLTHCPPPNLKKTCEFGVCLEFETCLGL